MLRAVGQVHDPKSGRGFELHITEPGVHFYTGGYLDRLVTERAAGHIASSASFTLETQKFRDARTSATYRSRGSIPGQEYHHIFELRFFR